MRRRLCTSLGSAEPSAFTGTRAAPGEASLGRPRAGVADGPACGRLQQAEDLLGLLVHGGAQLQEEFVELPDRRFERGFFTEQ